MSLRLPEIPWSFPGPLDTSRGEDLATGSGGATLCTSGDPEPSLGATRAFLDVASPPGCAVLFRTPLGAAVTRGGITGLVRPKGARDAGAPLLATVTRGRSGTSSLLGSSACSASAGAALIAKGLAMGEASPDFLTHRALVLIESTGESTAKKKQQEG